MTHLAEEHNLLWLQTHMNESTLHIAVECILILLPAALYCLGRPQLVPVVTAVLGCLYPFFVSVSPELNTVLHSTIVAVLVFVADDPIKKLSKKSSFVVSDSTLLLLSAFVASHFATARRNGTEKSAHQPMMWFACMVMILEIICTMASSAANFIWMVLLLVSVLVAHRCQKVYQLRLSFVEYFLLIVVVGMMWAAVLRVYDERTKYDSFGCTTVLSVSAAGTLCTMTALVVTVAVTNLLSQVSDQLHHGLAFIVLLSILIIFIFPLPVSAVIENQRRGAIDWILEFLTMDGYLRGKLCCLWLALIAVGGYLALISITHCRWNKVLSRKIFHVLIIVIIMPGLLWQSLFSFCILAMSVASCGFVVIETFRTSVLHKRQVCGQGSLSADLLSTYYDNFVDRRDLDRHWLSAHLYLLLGCSMPTLLYAMWDTIIRENAALGNKTFCNLSLLVHHAPLLPHLGWIIVGVGDSAAAIIGTQYGKHTWWDSKRTVEGSVAMLLTMIVAAVFAMQYMPSFAASTILLTEDDVLFSVLCTLIGATLMEAFTGENDNLVLPIFACALYTTIVQIQLSRRT